MSEQEKTSGKQAASGSLKQMRMKQAMSKERISDVEDVSGEAEVDSEPGPEKNNEHQQDRGRGRTSVRVTVDLESSQYKFLKHFAVEADSNSTRVLRGLLDLLEQDETLKERLVSDLGEAR